MPPHAPFCVCMLARWARGGGRPYRPSFAREHRNRDILPVSPFHIPADSLRSLSMRQRQDKTSTNANAANRSANLKRHRSGSRRRAIHCLSTATAMLAQKGSGFSCFRRALVGPVARSDVACLAFSPVSQLYKSNAALSRAFFGDSSLSINRKRHMRTIEMANTRIQPKSECITGSSTRLDAKGQNADDASVRTQKFLDSIRQSLVSNIIPEILKDTAEIKGPTIDYPLPVLLAVSGGCDSIALLHAMEQLTDKIENSTENTRIIRTSETIRQGATTYEILCKIHVVHFDHQQRGEESDGDKLFVKNLALEAGFAFHSFCWGEDDDADIEKKSSFSQDAARNWRRANLIQLANALTSENQSCDSVILTAHHRDDCDETVLLKLLRGAHISNLSGMDAVQRSGHCGVVFAKPMLDIAKTDIEHFLNTQGLTWREDSSNESNKYLRNRVRNELLPLLSDMVGGEEILHKRLESLDEQSRKVKADLLPRAAKYLTESDPTEVNRGIFPIPPDGTFTFVHEQALHTWAESQSGGNLILSYEQVKRVTEQISLYPQKKKWTLHVGKNWNVRRNGDVLLIEVNDANFATTMGGNGNVKASWKLCQDEKDIEEANVICEYIIQLLVPPATQINDLELKCVDGNQSNTFIPPWRKGRSPIKIKDFLRGQKVSLHNREGTPILCLGDVVVGVYIEDENSRGGRWIIHADYDAAGMDTALEEDSLVEICLVKIRLVDLNE